MKIWGIHKKYKGLSWSENFLGGHLSIGRLTIWGCNAMNYAANYHTKKYGYICFTLPVLARFKKYANWKKLPWYRRYYFDWYLYFSPNGTPWASTFHIGRDKQEKIRAQIRQLVLGHNFDVNKNQLKLRALNNKYDLLGLLDSEIKEITDDH